MYILLYYLYIYIKSEGLYFYGNFINIEKLFDKI